MHRRPLWRYVTAAVLVTACGTTKVASRRGGAGTGAPSSPATIDALSAAVTVSTLEPENRPGSVANKVNAGPRYMLLDAPAIEFKLRRFFGDATPSPLFGPSDRQKLGTFNVTSFSPAERRAQPLRVLTQDYLKVLRRALARGCQAVVDAEAASLPPGPAPANKVVVAPGAPTAEQVSSVMTRMLGYDPPAGGLHPGADLFAETFRLNLDEFVASDATLKGRPLEELVKSPAFTARLKIEYRLLCIAVGQHPQFITI